VTFEASSYPFGTIRIVQFPTAFTATPKYVPTDTALVPLWF